MRSNDGGRGYCMAYMFILKSCLALRNVVRNDDIKDHCLILSLAVVLYRVAEVCNSQIGKEVVCRTMKSLDCGTVNKKRRIYKRICHLDDKTFWMSLHAQNVFAWYTYSMTDYFWHFVMKWTTLGRMRFLKRLWRVTRMLRKIKLDL